MNRCCWIVPDPDAGMYPLSVQRRRTDRPTNPFAVDGRRPASVGRSLPSEERDLPLSCLIVEPYDKSLTECSSDPLQRREARQVLPTLQPANGGDTRSHSVGQLALGETVSDPPRDDHPGQRLIRLDSCRLGTVLVAACPSTSRGGALSSTDPQSLHDRKLPLLINEETRFVRAASRQCDDGSSLSTPPEVDRALTAIWHKGEQGWAILEPVGFPDEAALHTLVADAPQVLPLAGSPRLVVLGSEVRIGSGSADILGVEPSGRLAIIEVKLAKNAEARRAVVAQILTYAAYLRGASRESLEHDLLGSHLAKRQYAGVFEAVDENTQDGSVQAEAFLKGLDESLAAGAFRLVLVLDQAPAELVQLVGYLESVAPELTIDLVTVSKYSVDGAAILVPQRVDPERAEAVVPVKAASAASKGYYADGGADFRETAESLAEPLRQKTLRLYGWAKQLESDGLANLRGFHGTDYVTLLPYPIGHDAGLVTVASDGSLWTWRSVFEKRAPGSITAVETALKAPLKQGGTVRDPPDEVLDAIRSAYAAARHLAGEPTVPVGGQPTDGEPST